MIATDALRIEKDVRGHRVGSGWGPRAPAGSLAVHINSNPVGMMQRSTNMAVYPVGWLDDRWHHVAVTWQQHNGELQLLFDGQHIAPALVRDGWVKGDLVGAPRTTTLAAGSTRAAAGRKTLL